MIIYFSLWFSFDFTLIWLDFDVVAAEHYKRTWISRWVQTPCISTQTTADTMRDNNKWWRQENASCANSLTCCISLFCTQSLCVFCRGFLRVLSCWLLRSVAQNKRHSTNTHSVQIKLKFNETLLYACAFNELLNQPIVFFVVSLYIKLSNCSRKRAIHKIVIPFRCTRRGNLILDWKLFWF